MYPKDILKDKEKTKQYVENNEAENDSNMTNESDVQEENSNSKSDSNNGNLKRENADVLNRLGEEKGNTKPFPNILKHVSIVKVGKSSSDKTGIINNGFVLNGSLHNVNGLSKINEDMNKANKAVNTKEKDTEDCDNDAAKDAGSSGGKIKSTKDVKERETGMPDDDNKNDLLKSNMFGYLYLFNVLWFTVIRFRTNYFYGTINPLIEDVTRHDAEKGMTNPKLTQGPFVDSVDQDQTAQNVQSDLDLHYPIERNILCKK